MYTLSEFSTVNPTKFTGHVQSARDVYRTLLGRKFSEPEESATECNLDPEIWSQLPFVLGLLVLDYLVDTRESYKLISLSKQLRSRYLKVVDDIYLSNRLGFMPPRSRYQHWWTYNAGPFCRREFETLNVIDSGGDLTYDWFQMTELASVESLDSQIILFCDTQERNLPKSMFASSIIVFQA